MNDIVIYASSLEEHERKYNALIERLLKTNLKLQPDKCEFLKSEVTYLGHVISKDGVKPDPKKLEAVKLFPRSKTPKNIKQFLGLGGYYNRKNKYIFTYTYYMYTFIILYTFIFSL